MTKRRELLKVLSVAGAAGAVWKKPVVESVVLSAHAETTSTPTPTPSVPQGCYQLSQESGSPVIIQSIDWEGGIGTNASTTFTYNSSGCTGNGLDWIANTVAVAESVQDALDAGILCVEFSFSSPDLPDNLLFFLCD